MQPWQIESSPEVDAYMAGNKGLVDDLIDAIDSLATCEGLPDIGAMETEPGLFYWLVADHIVVYRRMAARQMVRIVTAKPE